VRERACVFLLLVPRPFLLSHALFLTVRFSRDKDTNEIVALKRVRMEKEKNGLPVTSLREILTLKKCSHPNVIRLQEIAVGARVKSMFLVFEYAENDLARILVRKFAVDELEISKRNHALAALTHKHTLS
jgi:serine/threonine protein kinase